ncbi:ATP-dependent helicase [Corynebacterium pseudotuberculosis]|uniref:ATP-dependent helicase n=1 Tax=Corynebacterium pseudotuberculosis TaxID=1719 RepID=UPI0020C8C4C4|nr:ATP-dependent DNA helicase [Corynebacterium pseudotuberculosis]UTO24999.1 ATP-dependent helicase [Corynebacterium pseudotuberculosis]
MNLSATSETPLTKDVHKVPGQEPTPAVGYLDSQRAAFRQPPTPQVRIVSADHHVETHNWENDLFKSQTGIWRLIGSAGSGVSTLIMDTVAERLRRGEDPSSILVIAASKEGATRLRTGIAARLSGESYTAAATMVRSVHSLAFALLRSLSGEDLRLITGAEQDAVIRELLQGHNEDPEAAQIWPQETRDALGFVGFARGLRDFLLRAVERGLSPEDLERLGNTYHRPMWKAAGAFLREYEQTMALGGAKSLSASELVSTVLEYHIPDQGWRTVIVDDAQHLDPKSAQLIGELLRYAEFGIIGGDPEQSVFHFRGASPEFLTKYPAEHQLMLKTTRRLPETTARIVENQGQHFEYVADKIRRAHLIDGVPWDDIAVIVRSTGLIAPIRRALLAAGVPVQVDPTDIILSEQRIVASMILAVRAIHGELNNRELEDLLLGPIGGADSVTLRRLYRGLRKVEMSRGGSRRAIELLKILISPRPSEEQNDLIGEAEEVLSERELQILERTRRVLLRGAQPGSVEEVLWAIWHETGLANHLQAVSLRGGAAGSQADRDLDAAMALFDAAGDWVERRPTAGIVSFMRHIAEQELPTGVRDRRQIRTQAVQLLTAHAALGQQWHTVIVAGVQEGSWPSLGETGTLFGQEELTDLIDSGIEPNTIVMRSKDRLDEERRLFHVAKSRATHCLYITAVEDPASNDVAEPSRFIEELDPSFFQQQSQENEASYADLSVPLAPKDTGLEDYIRLLSVPAMVAELRREVRNSDSPQRRRDQAARQLARLASAGVPGAHPEEWWGEGGPSTDQPLQQRSISPSLIEQGLTCPLRARLDAVIEGEETPFQMLKGSLAHAYAEAIARGVESETAKELTTEAFLRLLNAPAWQQETEKAAWIRMIERLEEWITVSAARYELVGVETSVNTKIAEGITIRGRIDRIERTQDGAYRIIDYKTGTRGLSAKEVADHKQLMAYQLALSKGKLSDTGDVISGNGEESLIVDQAVLVYPGSTTKKIKTCEQATKTPEELQEFADLLPPLIQNLTGPSLMAVVNDGCSNCSIINICPAQPEGRMTPA